MRRRKLLKNLGIATAGTAGTSSIAAAKNGSAANEKTDEDENEDDSRRENAKTEEGRYHYEELNKETIAEIDRKVEAGEIKIGDLGIKAPAHWEAESRYTIHATKTDSERIYVDFNDGEDPHPIELNTEMDGSFGHGWVNASWESDGSTNVKFEENTNVSGVDPDASIGTSDTTPDEVYLESEFSIGGVSVSISPSGGFETNGSSSVIYQETITSGDTTEASHEYFGLSASAPAVLFNANQSDSATFSWGNESVSLNTEVNKF